MACQGMMARRSRQSFCKTKNARLFEGFASSFGSAGVVCLCPETVKHATRPFRPSQTTV